MHPRYGASFRSFFACAAFTALALLPKSRRMKVANCAISSSLNRSANPGMPRLDGRCAVEGNALPLQARTLCDDGEAAHLMALQGAGIARKSIWDEAEDLQAGRLVEVLPDHALATSPLSAVHGSGKQLAPRVRVFLDYLLQHLRSTVAWRYANAD